MNVKREAMTMMRFGRFGWLLALIPVVLASSLIVACNESEVDEDPVVGATSVEVDDDFFSPRVIQVAAGTEVTWTWVGGRPHDVAGDGFQSDLQTNGTFAHRFAQTRLSLLIREWRWTRNLPPAVSSSLLTCAR